MSSFYHVSFTVNSYIFAGWLVSHSQQVLCRFAWVIILLCISQSLTECMFVCWHFFMLWRKTVENFLALFSCDLYINLSSCYNMFFLINIFQFFCFHYLVKRWQVSLSDVCRTLTLCLSYFQNINVIRCSQYSSIKSHFSSCVYKMYCNRFFWILENIYKNKLSLELEERPCYWLGPATGLGMDALHSGHPQLCSAHYPRNARVFWIC